MASRSYITVESIDWTGVQVSNLKVKQTLVQTANTCIRKLETTHADEFLFRLEHNEITWTEIVVREGKKKTHTKHNAKCFNISAINQYNIINHILFNTGYRLKCTAAEKIFGVAYVTGTVDRPLTLIVSVKKRSIQ